MRRPHSTFAFTAIFAAGLLVGVALIVSIGGHLRRTNELEPTSLDSTDTSASSAVVMEPSPESDANARVMPDPVQESHPKRAAQSEPLSTNTKLIRMPQIYDELLAPPRRQVTIEDMHARFKAEPRDEVWATAMEAGLSHHFANSGSGDWAVVEYIECRAQTCEIAGYLIEGNELHPSKLVEGVVQSGWWQGGDSVASSRHKGSGPERFVLILMHSPISDHSPPT